VIEPEIPKDIEIGEVSEPPAPCEHVWVYHDDEYGSLADGGSYAVYRCGKCGQFDYSPLPD
jgi:hypothetical protein